MKESTEKHLKVTIRIIKGKAEEKDKTWMTEQVKKEIKKRRALNRQQRNERREKNLIWERFKEQKIKVREQVKKEIAKKTRRRN